MNCKDWEERVALYAGGDLGPALESEVKRHLAECAGCRDDARGMEDTLALLRSAHNDPIAAGRYTAVRAGVVARLAREPRPWRRWVWTAGLAAGLAVAAVLVTPQPAKKPNATVAAVRRADAPPVAVRPAEPVVQTVRPRRRSPRRTVAPRQGEPLVVKLITNDPDVVIYWIADRKGENE